MKKRGKSIIIVILVLIILALGNHIIYTEYYKPKVTKEDKTIKEDKKEEKNDKTFIKKIDENKEYIYDGEYVGDFSKESYTTDSGKTYNSKDLKAPYFNIDSQDANNANKEVNETYLNAVRIFNQGVNDNSTYIKLDYKKYESSSVIEENNISEVADDDNLFDLIDSMYDK